MGILMIVGMVVAFSMMGGNVPGMGHGATAQPVHSSAHAPAISAQADENAQTPVTKTVTPGATN